MSLRILTLIGLLALLAAPVDAFAADAGKAASTARNGQKVSPTPSKDRGVVFQECKDCPVMTVVPAGQYMMGSADTDGAAYNKEESPQHAVTIPAPFAAGIYPVTRGEFAAFIKATGYQIPPACGVFTIPYVQGQQKFHVDPKGGWSNPNYAQTDDDPVVCVSWTDAHAYLDWVNKQATKGKKRAKSPYRLLTEAEWEYVARAGTTTRYFWGDDRNQACRYANGGDLTGKKVSPDWVVGDCEDGYVTTSPVGKFLPNPWGLYDIVGNAWQWVEDCWIDNYNGAPSDGSARLTAGCPVHTARGGSWRFDPIRGLRSASRGMDDTPAHFASVGFRVARTLE